MPAARTLPAPKSARHIAIAQAREAVAEATENYAYWRRQAAVRLNPKAAAEAAALRGAWQSTLAAREAHLEKLTASPRR